MFDDLQQVFGYQGAIDERTGVTEVGPDLLVVPCWTRQFCATVVRAAEALGAFEPQPDDPGPRSRGLAGRDQPAAVRDGAGRFRNAHLAAAADRVAVRRLLRAARRRSSSATPRASRSRCASITMSPRSRARSSSTRATVVPSCCSPPRLRQRLGRGRRDAGVAVAGHPSARNAAAHRGREVRADRVVRVAVVLRCRWVKLQVR